MPSDEEVARWSAAAAECVQLRCPHVVEKVARDADTHAAVLVAAVTGLCE